MVTKQAGKVSVCETITLEGQTFTVTRLQWVSGRGVRFFKGAEPLTIVPFKNHVQVH